MRKFNQHVLWCKLKEDPDQELPRMQDALERLVAKTKTAMLDNIIEDDPEWETHTRMSARSILKLLTATLTATAEELFPGE